MSSDVKLETMPGGMGPAYPVADMPEAPVKNLTPKKLFFLMGPAIIALGGSIGGGEWLVGPSLFVKYGLVLLWITTISTTLQTFLNLEMVRYTIVTGEPITLGFMRLAPGKAFWGILFTFVGFLERAMPGWAMGTATAVAAIQLGRLATSGEQNIVLIWSYIIFIACGVLVSIGGKIERTLEIANWIMLTVIIVSLLILDIAFAPASTWLEAIVGYVSFGQLPVGADILLLGALVGYSAYGGFGNTCLSNWYRDKGYGMSSKVGYIPSAFGGKAVHVSSTGMMPKATASNLEQFKGWWKLLNFDQWGVFWLGGMIGMLLPGLLYVTMIPRGTDLPSWGLAVSPASGMVQRFGPVGLYIVAFIGFWVLFSTAISNVDLVPRQATDMLWFASEKARKWSKGDIRKVYYVLLIAVIVWGAGFVPIALPLIIFALSANIANFTMALSALLTLIVNRKFLPKEMQPPLWREAILLLCVAFFGFFFTLLIMSKVFGITLLK